MIFVDANVFMYAVGGEHPLRRPSIEFFFEARRATSNPLFTSAEVLQELLHTYVPQGRADDLDAALQLAIDVCAEVWPVEVADVRLGRTLMRSYPALSARGLLHLASCRRRNVRAMKTYDRALAAAFA